MMNFWQIQVRFPLKNWSETTEVSSHRRKDVMLSLQLRRNEPGQHFRLLAVGSGDPEPGRERLTKVPDRKTADKDVICSGKLAA